MDVDQPTPTSPLRRKRTFHDLTDSTSSLALSSLALQTPNPQEADPHYETDYFGDSDINPFQVISTTQGHGHPGSSPQRTERSISPSKRVRTLTDRTRPSNDAAFGAASPTRQHHPILSEDTDMNNDAAVPSCSYQPGTITPATTPTPTFNVPALLHHLHTLTGLPPTANFSALTPTSTVLLYICPPLSTSSFGANSKGYSPPSLSNGSSISGLGTYYAPLCHIVHQLPAALGRELQVLGLSDRLDLAAQGQGDYAVQRLAGVVPVRRAAEVVGELLRVVGGMVGVGLGLGLEVQGGVRFGEGALTIIDGEGRIRMVLPLGDLDGLVRGSVGFVEGMGMAAAAEVVSRRKAAAVTALEEAVREGLGVLEAEKGWSGHRR